MTLYQVLHELQIVLTLILGACPLCTQPLPSTGSPPPSLRPNKVLVGVGLVLGALGAGAQVGP